MVNIIVYNSSGLVDFAIHEVPSITNITATEVRYYDKRGRDCRFELSEGDVLEIRRIR